jgi:hypothetical protein
MVITFSAMGPQPKCPITVAEQADPMNYVMLTSHTARFRAAHPQTVRETLRYIVLASVLFAMTIVVAVVLS